MRLSFGWIAVVLVSTSTFAAELTPAERGKQYLTGKSYNPPVWSMNAYRSAWKQWPEKPTKAPDDYDRAFRDHYGLHEPTFPNDHLPMGLRKSSIFLYSGVSIDCMICHSGSIAGKSYIGLGNSSLDIQALFDDLNHAEGRNVRTPFIFSRVRGTNEAGGMGVYLLGYREPDLGLRTSRIELGLHDDLCEDVPAWWHLKKKRTMYYTGGGDARSVRSLMQFMMAPTNTTSSFDKAESDFRDIQAYLLSIEPPKYPFPIDQPLADRGRVVFDANCKSCHGTYGKEWTYPNKSIPLDKIGTDPTRYHGITEEYGRYYNKSWFAQEQKGWFFDEKWARQSPGYQAPPLDGIWATAPYLHNGSVPTLYHLLKSDSRPTMFTRSFLTQSSEYDPEKVGWKIQLVKEINPSLHEFEQRKIYDTRQKGRGNQGHTFGDELSDDERRSLIEYLKTL